MMTTLDDQQGLQYARLGCKRWTCDYCGPRKARRFRRAIIDKAVEKKLNRFLTLTLNPTACSPQDSPAYINACWHKFRTYLKRRHGNRVSFIKVIELQKSGYAHLHILVDRYIEQEWISRAWQAVGGGKIVHITMVDIHRIAPYLSKYLTKSFTGGCFRKRQRRFTTSRDIVLFAKSLKKKWMVIEERIELLIYKAGHTVFEEQRNGEGVLQGFKTVEIVGF